MRESPIRYIDFFNYLFEDKVVNEGVHDQGSFKSVILVGGPGSGKSFTASVLFGMPRGMSFSEGGLKYVNSDPYFEHLLKKNNISTKLSELSPEDLNKAMELRQQAKEIQERQLARHLEEGTGIILESTGEKPEKIKAKIKRLQESGYDTTLMFVDTPLEVALERNRNRDRTLADDVVAGIHAKVRSTIDGLTRDAEEMGVDIITVNNDGTVHPRELLRTEIGKAARRVTSSPIRNPIGIQRTREMAKGISRSLRRRMGVTRRSPTSTQSNLGTNSPIDSPASAMDGTVINPHTGNEILIRSALTYDKSHPAYIAASKIVMAELQNKTLSEKNIPTSPDKWEKAKAAAKRKFDVYPSAYANLWAAKKYKSMGGGWKKGKK